MTIWIIADTHFNHKNLVEWGIRPLGYEYLIHMELKKIQPTDTLIHLGDIDMGSTKSVHEREFMPLECYTILVLGNHDNKSDGWYKRHGWNFVCTSFTNTYFGKKVKFSHHPTVWDGSFDVNIHGHLHDLGHREDSRNIMNELISLELNNYKLVNLDSLIKTRYKEVDCEL